MHHGKTLKKIITESGISVQELSNRSGISRTTLYSQFGTKHLPEEKIEKIFIALNIKMDYSNFETISQLGEEATTYDIKHNQSELSYKDKYIALLEENNSLMREKADLKERLHRAENGTNESE